MDADAKAESSRRSPTSYRTSSFHSHQGWMITRGRRQWHERNYCFRIVKPALCSCSCPALLRMTESCSYDMSAALYYYVRTNSFSGPILQTCRERRCDTSIAVSSERPYRSEWGN